MKRTSTRALGLLILGASLLARIGSGCVYDLSFESFPSGEPGTWILVHTYLLAQHGVYEFAFIGASPLRPLAMPLRGSAPR